MDNSTNTKPKASFISAVTNLFWSPDKKKGSPKKDAVSLEQLNRIGSSPISKSPTGNDRNKNRALSISKESLNNNTRANLRASEIVYESSSEPTSEGRSRSESSPSIMVAPSPDRPLSKSYPSTPISVAPSQTTNATSIEEALMESTKQLSKSCESPSDTTLATSPNSVVPPSLLNDPKDAIRFLTNFSHRSQKTPCGFRDQDRYHRRRGSQLFVRKLIDQLKVWENVEVPMCKETCCSNLKFIIRKGVPDTVRAQVWKTVTGCREFELKNDTFYAEAMYRVFGTRIPKQILEIPLFGGVFKPEEHFLAPEGILAARRILCVFAMEHPQMEYLPQMPDLVCILLSFLTESEAYTSIHLMMQESAEGIHKYFNASRKAMNMCLLTTEDLIKQHLPKIYQHFASLGVTSQNFTDNYFNRLFVGSFPYQTVLRIFDTFLSEGRKILYRAMLGFLKSLQQQILKTKSGEEVLKLIDTWGKQCTDSDPLMKHAFEIRIKRRHYLKYDQKNYKQRRVSQVIESVQMYYRPKLTTPSHIIEEEHFEILWGWLPSRFRIRDPVLLYSTHTQGYNLANISNSLQAIHPTILIIKTRNADIFGAFMTASWEPANGYKGNRDTYLWRLTNEHCKFPYPEGGTEFFTRVSKDHIEIGGGEGYGIYLDKELSKGKTQTCTTFHNPPLTIDGSEDFECVALEIYGFS